MTKNINIPSFDGTVNLQGLAIVAKLQLDFKASALMEGDHLKAQYYDRKAVVYEKIVDAIAGNALIPLSDLLQLPDIVSLVIPMTTETVHMEIQEAEEITEIKASVTKGEFTEIVRGKLNTPKVEKQILEFKGAMADIVANSQLDGYDLFKLNKAREKTIRAKIKANERLTDDELEMIHTKEIRETLLQLIHSGARIEAIDYIKNWLFKWKNYSDRDAHLLIEALKKKYRVEEPKTTPHITINSLIDIPPKQWMYLSYINIDEEKKEENISAYGYLNPDTGIMSAEGKLLCEPKFAKKYRLVNAYENRKINIVLKDI